MRLLRRLPAPPTAPSVVTLPLRTSRGLHAAAPPAAASLLARRRPLSQSPPAAAVTDPAPPPPPLALGALQLLGGQRAALTTARRREEAEGKGGGAAAGANHHQRKRKKPPASASGASASAAGGDEEEDESGGGKDAGSGGGVAIDNTGLLDGFHHADPPTASQLAAHAHVKGARLLGGNVVWRASAAEAGPPAASLEGSREALWERANATLSLAAVAKDHRHLDEPPDWRSLGVIEPEKELDLQLMIQNYTVPALAAGLRDREETLQLCARLLADGDLAQLEKVLHPYQAGLITRRRRKTRSLDLAGGLTSQHLNMLRKYLQRAPRHLTRAVSLRASVVIPLCNVDGVASVLFERRSHKVRSFKNQVCFPGGMVEEARDVNIIETSLREMEEEIGFPAKQVDVLGVLRCDWSEVHKITGIGVTPVVGFLGDLTERTLAPNPDEVAECFTVPLAALLKDEHWSDDAEHKTVVFVGGPHIVWGLTAYICKIFISDILKRYKITY